MSLAEFSLILVAAFVFLGPNKLRIIAYRFGKIYARYKKILSDFSEDIENNLRLSQREAQARSADDMYQKKDSSHLS